MKKCLNQKIINIKIKNRKDPLEKEIKVSENQKQIEKIFKSELAENVKKGWEKISLN
jgi:hypothetical protein